VESLEVVNPLDRNLKVYPLRIGLDLKQEGGSAGVEHGERDEGAQSIGGEREPKYVTTKSITYILEHP
jgi:hypothetical protein